MTLQDVLKAKPLSIVTIRSDSTIVDAIKVMTGANIGSIMVVDADNKLVGIFTERDVLRMVGKNIPFDKEPVRTVMSSNLMTLDPSADISVAISLMSRKKIRHLPIMDGDRILGMISYRDLIAYVLPEICYKLEEIY